MNLMPSIEIRDGQVIRMRQRDFARPKLYASQPEQVGELLAEAGIKRVLVTDCTGLRTKTPAGLHWIRHFANLGLNVWFRSGIAYQNAAELALELGAEKVIVELPKGKSFQEAYPEWNSDKMILALDAWEGISAYGRSPLLQEVAQLTSMGVTQFLVSDLKREGMLLGPDMNLIARLGKYASKVNFIYGGGLRDTRDLERIGSFGLAGAVVGKAIFEGRLSMLEVARRQTLVPAENKPLTEMQPVL